ncbi:MAG: hypothetical protein IJX99_01415 [Clostridia bacterium]|nr:hypothetical protein [Clostridia bacterium]
MEKLSSEVIMNPIEVVPMYGVQPPIEKEKTVGILVAAVTGVVIVAVGIVAFIKRKNKKKKGEISNEEIKK